SFFPFKTQMKFDMVHTSHWLEHTLNLDETFGIISCLLENNGIWFIEVPNTGGEYWSLDLNDEPHFHFFTIPSLVNLANQFGFRIRHSGLYGNTWREYLNVYDRAVNNFDTFDESGDLNSAWIRMILEKRS
ncbi:methyltransferase domain-containing protein, partial [Litorivicinus sp.]|nr:methyltransferase domain-containing protein [Litorivicinus sp.]